MITTELTRVFLYKEHGQELELADPNPDMQPEEVLNHYSTTYPTFTTAKVQGPFWENDREEYKIVSVLGTKG